MATTKRDIVKKVAASVGEKRGKIAQIFEIVLEEFAASLVAGERIELRDFGVFSVVTRKARLARNPKTGEAVQVPEKSVVKFKPGRLLKERVSQSGQRKD